MRSTTLAQRLLELLDPDGAPPAPEATAGADESAVARAHGVLRAREGSPPTRLVEDHARLRQPADAAGDRSLSMALAAYTAERERIRRVLTERTMHDLRNALGAITMTAQRWLRALPPVAPQEDAALLLRQAVQVQALMEAWHQRQEPAAGAAAWLTPVHSSLAAECRESLVELRAAHPGLAIRFEADTSAPARFDAARLREALGHLVARFARRGAAAVSVHVWCQAQARVGLTVEASHVAGQGAGERRWEDRLDWLAVRQTARAHGGDAHVDGRSATLWLPAEAA